METVLGQPARRRQLMIDLCRRRIQPGSGSSERFLRERTTMKRWPDFSDALEGLRWAVAGAVATRLYMPERATRDLDIVAEIKAGEAILTRLQAEGYRLLSRLSIPGYSLEAPDGVEVDVILSEAPWLDEALASTRRDAAGLPVLDLPYLVLMKLGASRAQDVADVARMLGQASDEDLQRVREVFGRFAPEAVDDVGALVELGRLELAESDSSR